MVGLHRKVRDGLAEVVGGPRERAAVGGLGLGDRDDQHRGVAGPHLVEAEERVVDALVRGGAPAGDDEAPRLGVVRGGRPAGGFERARELGLVDRVVGRVGPGAPAFGQDVEHGGIGLGGAVQQGNGHGDLASLIRMDGVAVGPPPPTAFIGMYSHGPESGRDERMPRPPRPPGQWSRHPRIDGDQPRSASPSLTRAPMRSSEFW